MANRHTFGTPASHTRGELPRTVPEGGTATPIPGAGPGARHLYVHLPFCAHRCGYCDFVTVTGHDGEHGGYVDALLAELELERGLLAHEVETVFLGGGTPTFTEPAALARLLAGLPDAAETTVEANPETVTPELAALLRAHGVDRVSLGAQSFQAHLLETLERRASPDDVRGAVGTLREAGFDNVSLDLIYGIPGQSVADLERDLAEALALEPEHLSCYELEAKPGTRFTHAHGDGARAPERGDGGLLRARRRDAHRRRLPLVRDRELLPHRRPPRPPCSPQPRLLARPRLPRRSASAPSRPSTACAGGTRRACRAISPRSAAASGRSASSSSSSRQRPRASASCSASASTSRSTLNGLDAAVDRDALARLQRHGLIEATGDTLELTRRGRFLGGGVTAELLVES